MKLKDLFDAIVDLHDIEDWGDLNVGIPNGRWGIGGLPTTKVRFAHKGFDWDSGTFFIIPENPMTERGDLITKAKMNDILIDFCAYIDTNNIDLSQGPSQASKALRGFLQSKVPAKKVTTYRKKQIKSIKDKKKSKKSDDNVQNNRR